MRGGYTAQNRIEQEAGVLAVSPIRDEFLSACGGVECVGALPPVRPGMIGQADLVESWRDAPSADRTAGPGQAKLIMRCLCDPALPKIQRVIRVPFSKRVRMTHREPRQLITRARVNKPLATRVSEW